MIYFSTKGMYLLQYILIYSDIIMRTRKPRGFPSFTIYKIT